MNLDNINDRTGMVGDLIEYAISITNKMSNDGDNYQMLRLSEQLLTINELIIAEYKFDCALYEMNNMKQSDEDSKWTFPFEKALNEFVKETFLSGIDDLIDRSRSWSFEDYRARNFQNELYQKMTMLKDWYTEAYDSEDDDDE